MPIHNIGDLVVTKLLDDSIVFGLISDLTTDNEYIVTWFVDYTEVIFRHDEEGITKLKLNLEDYLSHGTIKDQIGKT